MESNRKPGSKNGSRRPSAGNSARTLWTAGLALVAVILVITRLNGDPSPVASKVLLGVVVLFLVVRQIARRRGGNGPRAAEPDPQSRLNLD